MNPITNQAEIIYNINYREITSEFSDHFNVYPEALNEYLDGLFRFDKALNLIQKVKKKGQIRLKFFNSQYRAAWSAVERTIYLSLGSDRQLELTSAVFNILIELHNAMNTLKFILLHHKAIKNKITQVKYVDAIERIEYQNTYETVQLIEEGVAKGFYPSSTKLGSVPAYEVHLAHQIILGHSQHYFSMYENYHRIGECLRSQQIEEENREKSNNSEDATCNENSQSRKRKRKN